MEKIFIRERINIINYKNENQGLIYTSSDADILGGAVNVVLEADVGGWYQLTFDMPSYIFIEGKPISNPLLKNLFPLAKLQYTRVIERAMKKKNLFCISLYSLKWVLEMIQVLFYRVLPVLTIQDMCYLRLKMVSQ